MCFFYFRIDIPVLNDQFDASLVIMRKRFCWDYTDIFYAKQVVTHSEKTALSAKSKKKLLSAEVNLGESLLYEAIRFRWWSQPELQQKDFWEEVSQNLLYFSNIVQATCVQ